MTKYEKLEAEYNALETPEQQWAWVLAHKDEVMLWVDKAFGMVKVGFKNRPCLVFMNIGGSGMILPLLSVLCIEAEEV